MPHDQHYPLRHFFRTLFLKPSARELLAEADKNPDYTFFDRLHMYVYLRWPKFYIGVGVGEHWLSRPLEKLYDLLDGLFGPPGRRQENEPRINFADTYHGKVLPTDSAKRLITVNRPIELKNLESIIPYATARDIVLSDPDHILALECPCRAVRENPCHPMDVCLLVGEPFVNFVMEHHKRGWRRITQEEAVAIIEAEHKRGHVHHAFFKDAMLGRYYAVCNCCSCCCGAMQAQRNGVEMLAPSGYVCRADETSCIGCGLCVKACQFHALTIEDKVVRIDAEACMGCGACTSQCPQDVLRLERDPAKGEPLEIEKLLARAANDGD